MDGQAELVHRPPTLEETEMNNRMVATLILSTAIALPAFTQQTNSGASSQSAAPADQAAGGPPLQEIHGDFWDGEEPGAAALILHPFATKGYVKRQTTPIRDRLNELEEITAEHGRTTNDIDTRAQHGVQLASTKTRDADQHAAEATTKSQAALEAANGVSTHLSRVEPVVGNIDQYKAGTATEIRFRPGQTVLSKDAKQALDEMATSLHDQHGYVIEVHGFSSGGGQAAIAASRRMADSVVRYFVLNHEIPAYRIYAVGMGNTPDKGTATKRTSGSRVEISVLKNM